MDRGRVLRLEFGDDELRRLAYEPGYTPRRWSADVVRAYRKKVQMIGSAVDERDLRAVRSLHLEQLQGARQGTSSIRINDQLRLILTFKTEGDRVAVLLELVDYH